MKCLGLFHVTKQVRQGVQSSVDYKTCVGDQFIGFLC